jgi:hypothetical protein
MMELWRSEQMTLVQVRTITARSRLVAHIGPAPVILLCSKPRCFVCSSSSPKRPLMPLLRSLVILDCCSSRTSTPEPMLSSASTRTRHDLLFLAPVRTLYEFMRVFCQRVVIQGPLQVKRCNEMARRLRFFYEQVTVAGIPRQSANIMDAVSPLQLEELEVRPRRQLALSMSFTTGWYSWLPFRH